MTLRPYQEAAVKKLVWAMDLPGNDVVCIAQGGGKSLVIAELAHRLGKPVLILCPNKEILEQNIEKMEQYVGRDEIGVYSASLNEKTVKNITFGTIQSMYKSPEKFKGFDVAIYDECFVAGTKVGRKNIENIKVGDYVDSYNHFYGGFEKKRVTRVMKNELKSELYLTSCTDSSIISTGNHPVYVKDKGYTPVIDLKVGDVIYAKQTQPNTTTTVHRMREDGGVEELSPVLEIQANWKHISQDMLLHSPWGFNFKDEEIPANTLFRIIQREDVFEIEIYRSQADDSRGEWQTIIKGGEETIRLAWKYLGDRSCGKKGNSTISLQDRHSSSDQENSHRNRWWGSWITQSKRRRSKKRTVLTEQRVESVEIYKPRDSQKNGKNSDTTTYVYNLEVEGNHNYFANGLLVHNCDLHNPKNLTGMSNKLFKQAGIKKVFGFTGTPFRQAVRYERWGQRSWMVTSVTTTKMITRIAPRFWDRMLTVVNTCDLVDQKYLSPIEYHEVSLFEHENIPTNKSKSEFDLDRFSDMVSRKEQYIADTIEQINHKAKLVFCATIKQANGLQELIEGSVVVTSETTRKERERIIRELKLGQIRVVLNVGIFTVGFDYPELDCIILLRPTRSLRLHCQILGRVSRIAQGKEKGHVYDLVSNVKNLGRLVDIKIEKVNGKWDVTGGRYPTGYHDKPLYSFKLRKPKEKDEPRTGFAGRN